MVIFPNIFRSMETVDDFMNNQLGTQAIIKLGQGVRGNFWRVIKPLKKGCPGGENKIHLVGDVEYPLIAITHRSTLTPSGGTC